MQKRIEDLPKKYQELYSEFSLEKDIDEGLRSEIIIYPTNFDIDDSIFDSLESVETSEDESEYDDNDENTFDLRCVSPNLKRVFGE